MMRMPAVVAATSATAGDDAEHDQHPQQGVVDTGRRQAGDDRLRRAAGVDAPPADSGPGRRGRRSSACDSAAISRELCRLPRAEISARGTVGGDDAGVDRPSAPRPRRRPADGLAGRVEELRARARPPGESRRGRPWRRRQHAGAAHRRPSPVAAAGRTSKIAAERRPASSSCSSSWCIRKRCSASSVTTPMPAHTTASSSDLGDEQPGPQRPGARRPEARSAPRTLSGRA